MPLLRALDRKKGKKPFNRPGGRGGKKKKAFGEKKGTSIVTHPSSSRWGGGKKKGFLDCPPPREGEKKEGEKGGKGGAGIINHFHSLRGRGEGKGRKILPPLDYLRDGEGGKKGESRGKKKPR